MENDNHPLTNGTYDDEIICQVCRRPVDAESVLVGELSRVHKKCWVPKGSQPKAEEAKDH